MEKPTFSQNWSRVSRLTPLLRPHVQITRQLFRGAPWHVVHDPVNNNFFRLNPVAYHFVGLLDGRRSIDDAWALTCNRYGDGAPTQNEVIGLLGQLNQSNLLRVDLPPDAAPLLERSRKRKMQFWMGQAMSILFVKIPIFNPDRILTWALPIVKPILNKIGMVAWVLWMLFCTYNFLPHLREFINDAESVLAPSNWGWMVLLFILTKAFHEFGHGITCKRFGGIVPETGIMMLVMFPAPFVDATASWSFSQKWRRILVSAAGMLFELPIAGAAALVWLHTEQGSLPSQIAYNTVFLASVTTILFNANPLLRFDGYYMLSDFLEIPNLYDRSSKHTHYLIQKFIFGMELATPISTLVYEQWALFIYGIASQIYRVLVLVGIILFISGQFLSIGLALAAWSFIAWILVPTGKLIHWIFTDPVLGEQRTRAIVTSIAFLMVMFIALGMIPANEYRRTQGIIESENRSDLVVGSDGFVTQVLVDIGQLVQKDQVILVAYNPKLAARKQQLQATLKRLAIERRKGLGSDPVAMRIAETKQIVSRKELDEIENRLTHLTLRSPIRGTLVGTMIKQLQGQFLPRGQVIAKVVDLDHLRVTALLDQSQASSAFFSDIQKVECRTAGLISTPLPSTLIKIFNSGRNTLPHPALGYAGGGTIAIDRKDPQGTTTTRPQFELWLTVPKTYGLQNRPLTSLPGQRVYVRFTLPKRPLLQQWIHRFRQIVRDQLSI